MDCEVGSNGSAICGNFAQIQDSKPKNMDYMQTAKWYEQYPFDWRETMGGVICNCKQVIVHYAPYFGYDFFHIDSCNLMRKLHAEPQIQNLREIYLPAINNWTDSVPDRKNIPLYIKGRSSAYKIRVKAQLPQLSLV